MHIGKLTTENVLSSTMDANIKNMTYIMKQTIPTVRFNWNLLINKAPYKISNVEKRDIELYTRPRELICTKYSPGIFGSKEAFMNHGSPRHNNTSNTFEPIELLIPIAP